MFVWAFVVRGLLGRRQPGSTGPCFVVKRWRRTTTTRTARERQATGSGSPVPMTCSKAPARNGSGCDTGYRFWTNRDADSEAG